MGAALCKIKELEAVEAAVNGEAAGEDGGGVVNGQQQQQLNPSPQPPPRLATAEEIHKGIEYELQQSSLLERHIMKMLLLGSSDSGKSTIARQMRILRANGFSQIELLNYRRMILGNLVSAFHSITRGVFRLGILVEPGEMGILDLFDSTYIGLSNLDIREQIEMITRIHACQCIQKAIERLNEFYAPDNTSYLLAEASRILQPDYQPTVADVLHARAPTTGVYEINFQFKHFSIQLIDVGGQKTERRKWIHCFDKVTAVVFVAALSCYNETMLDEADSISIVRRQHQQNLELDAPTNRMEDSVALFREIYQNKYFRRSSFILFLNKRDIFEERIKSVPIEKYFPKFKEWAINNDGKLMKAGIRFFKNLYVEISLPAEESDSPENEIRRIYTHVTNATDTKNIEFVFDAACTMILQTNMKKAGLQT